MKGKVAVCAGQFRSKNMLPEMISLTNRQLQTVMNAARMLPVEKRDLYLQRIAAMLNMRGRRFSDDDLIEITRLAATGLAHQPAA